MTNSTFADLASFTRDGAFLREMPDAASANAVCEYLLCLVTSTRHPATLSAACYSLETQLELKCSAVGGSSSSWCVSWQLVTAVLVNLGVKVSHLPKFSETALLEFVKSIRQQDVQEREHDSLDFFQMKQVLHCFWVMLKASVSDSQSGAAIFWQTEALDALFFFLIAVLADQLICRKMLLHQLVPPCLDQLLANYSKEVWIEKEKVLDMVEKLAELPRAVWYQVLERMPQKDRSMLLRRLSAYFLLQKLHGVTVIDLPVAVTVPDVVKQVEGVPWLVEKSSSNWSRQQLETLLLSIQLIDLAVGSGKVHNAEQCYLLMLVEMIGDLSHIRDTIDELSELRTELKNIALCLVTKWKSMAGVDSLLQSMRDMGFKHIKSEQLENSKSST